MNKFLIPIILVALLALGATVLLRIFDTQRKGIPTITVASQPAMGTALFHIAEEKKFFEQEGITIQVLEVQSGDEISKAIVSNSADVGTAGMVPYSFLALDSPDIKVFGLTAYAHDTKTIARRDKGIETPADLKSKKIGFTKNTASDIGLDTFLAANNLTLSNVVPVNLKPLAMPTALAAGEIDAYVIWEPFLLNGAALIGDNAILFSRPEEVYTWHAGLIARESYIEQNQEALKKFVSAIRQAEEFAKSSQEEAITIVANRAKLPRESVSKIWSEYEFALSLRGLNEILAADVAWANSKRERKMPTLPEPESLINRSILNETI